MGEIRTSVIVVADTHFGLNTNAEACDSNAFSDFLKWIKELEKGNKKQLKIGDWLSSDGKTTLTFEPPEKIILLGDILELWTASNEEILASTIHLIQVLSELKCEKIYVLGNHDRDLMQIAGCYPLGDTPIKIVATDEYWISKRKEDYRFLHGHQFDKHFDFKLWKLMVLFRKPALAFGNWSWFIVVLYFLDWATVIAGLGGVVNWLLLGLLHFITLPFLAFKIGRPIWNWWNSIRFDPDAAKKAVLERLDKIWNLFEETVDPNIGLNVVYGHTHTIGIWNVYGYNKEVRSNTVETYDRPIMNIMNIPSWVTERPKESDSNEETIEQEISNVFLYITEDNPPLFIGWDTKNKKPFLIPHEVIFEKRENGNISNIDLEYDDGFILNKGNIEQKLIDIDWPEELINKWITGFKIKNQ